MLTNGTKRKIDNARDILVGKIPMPTSQVEQITLALIYKFMSDMDKKTKALGGKDGFFANGYEKYSWDEIMDKSISARDRVITYSEGLEKMSQNPHIPQLFRDIFKNAFLPFRSPETLKMFLDQIDEFEYSHSEELGNAFEYLLSILSSQGDAGQFRTPRHIIDFIIKVVDPDKNDTILDPACGTAGFLISAYKHILSKGLNAEEQKKLTENFTGYDISQDMQRLSLVNMYLHHFPDPHIYEYDTLSSEDRWDEDFDCILANPPFMSPKGGIQPHSRFAIKSKRSEVLFVDYIMEHLTVNGKAGVIVPEGIIFQSQNAYKSLRKMMVEDNYLWAVVSLPAGVFNPYSGVKTSILLFDKQIAKKTNKILFVKVENDGFDLGAQRRSIDKNDLPISLALLKKYKKSILDGKELKEEDVLEMGGATSEKETMSSYGFDLSSDSQIELSQIINKAYIEAKKKEIEESGDFNLSGERYLKTNSNKNSYYEMLELGKIAKIINGRAYKRNELLKKGKYKVLRVGNFFSNRSWYYSNLELSDEKYCNKGDLLYAWSASFGPKIWDGSKTIFHYHIWKIENDENLIDKKFLYYLLKGDTEKIKSEGGRGIAMMHITKSGIEKRKFPLPPISVQQEIVEELDSYQKIIDGAKQVVENYKPSFKIDDEWERKRISEIAKLEYGIGESAKNSGELRYVRITDISENGKLREVNKKYIKETTRSKNYLLNKGDVLVARTGATYGKTLYFDKEEKSAFAGFLMRINFDKKIVNSKYFWCFAQSENYWSQAKSLVTGGGQPQFNAKAVGKIIVPIPPINIQNKIVFRINEEQKLINSNKQLIKIFENKIKEKIEEIWNQ